jgi:hypothetical protein
MFGRSNWAIIGLKTETLPKFKGGLDTLETMLTHSQLAAAAITRYLNRDSIGINPFRKPRLDEEHGISDVLASELMGYASASPEDRKDREISRDLQDHDGYAFGLDAFALDTSITLFGLWVVINSYKDVSHVATLREQHANDDFARPYKFLAPTDKKIVDAETRPGTAAIRKQFPVLIDYREGRIYIESTSKADVMAVQEILSGLGAETTSLAWRFGEGHWPSQVLSKLYGNTLHKDAFVKRAEETSRFRSDEIEKLEDSEMQKLVSKFFSTTELGGDKYANLSAPAQITLHPTSGPIAVQSPTNATTLLGVTEEAGVFSASVTLQERITITKKKTGEERTFRKDLVCFDINDALNLVDVGAALLRGFDLPTFKKDIQREIKSSKKVPSLDEFWMHWLIDMANGVRTIETEIAEVLEIEGDGFGIQPLYSDDGSDEVIENVVISDGFKSIAKMIGEGNLTVTVTHAIGSEAGE